jgi:hypothetical protein
MKASAVSSSASNTKSNSGFVSYFFHTSAFMYARVLRTAYRNTYRSQRVLSELGLISGGPVGLEALRVTEPTVSADDSVFNDCRGNEKRNYTPEVGLVTKCVIPI